MEIYKDILGYEGLYQVSNFGNVKSVKRTVEIKINIKRTINECILKPIKDSYGYLSVDLSKNRLAKRIKIHRLVALAFIPNYKNKPIINHINGIKTDNITKNLEWCTYSENTIHSYKIGLMNANGTNNGRCKLTEKQVLEIRKNSENLSQRKLSIIYNVSNCLICDIINNKKWIHI
jgi:hypothetical protein